jgi:hypothetical protein
VKKAVLVFFLIFNYALAQEGEFPVCGFDQRLREQIKENPGLLERISAEPEYSARFKMESAVITVPVVVHILYFNSEQNLPKQQIESQIAVLNEDFRKLNYDTVKIPDRFKEFAADPQIEFCLAQFDPEGNPTDGIVRVAVGIEEIGATDKYYRASTGGSDIWDPRYYLNIWVCEIDGKTLGFAYLPGSTTANKDGIVVDYRTFGTVGRLAVDHNLGRTTTHEVGHYFNLLHPWGNEEGCEFDDGVSDTPLQEKPNAHCPDGPRFSCDNAPLGDMHMNYMDYTMDRCSNLFTQGQKSRMLAALNNYRETLYSSTGCTGPDTSTNIVERVALFPNPNSQGLLKIDVLLEKEQTADIKLYSIDGREILSDQRVVKKRVLEYPIDHLQSGIYILNFVSGSYKSSMKYIVIQ